MTEYEGNGDYGNYDEESDFKRKSGNDSDGGKENENAVVLNEKASDYIRDCLLEKSKLEKKYPIAEKLLESEIEKVQSTGRIPSRDPKYVDIYREKPIRVSQKVLVPVREHPKFNFVGKLLGPKGNSLRRLQEETLCKMTVLGRNSMKDRAKEEELRISCDPKYLHLNDDLHVEISTIAPPAEAHARIAYAMAEVRKYLIPDANDIIRQEQLRELMDNPNAVAAAAAAAAAADNDPPSKGSSYKPKHPNSGPRPTYYRPTSGSHPPGHPQSSRGALPPKQKVLSILDRARNAMEDYGNNRHYEDQAQYEPYDYGYSHPPVSGRGAPYEVEYDGEYRREYYPPHSPSYQEYEPAQKMIKSSSSSSRHAWKHTPEPYYPQHSSNERGSSRRDEHPTGGSSSSKHSSSSREARYKNAPYVRSK